MITEIENIRLSRFDRIDRSLHEDYMRVLTALRPRPRLGPFKARRLTGLTFSEVTLIRGWFAEGNTMGLLKAMELVFGCKRERLGQFRVVDYFHAFNWLTRELEFLAEQEQRHLSGKLGPELEMAGVRRLDRFKELNALVALAVQFGITPQEVEKWNYGLVFSLLWYNKVYREVEKDHLEIIRKNNG